MKKAFMILIVCVGLFLSINGASAASTNVTAVSTASGNVQSYVEANHSTPSTVNVSGNQVNKAQFLKLETEAVLNINNSNENSSINIGSYSTASKPQEALAKSINLNKTQYLSMAARISSFMNTNGVAPNYCFLNGTSGDYICPDSLIYMYAQILNSYNTNGVLPDFITLNKWSVISNTSTTFFTISQIDNAATTVKNYIETNHQLPSSVTISGKQVSMSNLLKLETSAILDVNGNLNTKLVYLNYGTATSPQETILTSIKLTNSDYVDVASRVLSFMCTNVLAPNYSTIDTPQYTNSPQSKIRFESLIYTFSQVLNSYNTNNVLPDFAIVTQWSVVSNASTIFASMSDIENATTTVKNYIETNHQLPSSVTVSGKQINMAQFLQLTTTSVLNIEGNVNALIAIGNYTNPTYPVENLTDGSMSDDEYLKIANRVLYFMESRGAAPNYEGDTSLGSKMRFESLIYLYAQVISSYATNNKTLPDPVTITPWITITNPNETYNFNTQKAFNSIQAAINDSSTKDGDTITLGNSNYTENVDINKVLTIIPITTLNTSTVQAANINLPVFTIESNGTGSIIENLVITGATNNAGIYINNSNNNTITENNIQNNLNGVYLNNSNTNVIIENSIFNNTLNGVSSYNSLNSNILTNNIIYNGNAGIYLNSSSAQINFNRIAGNTAHGLCNEGNGTVNAENNWWGSNNPTTSPNNTSDINIISGTVNHDQWLILNITNSCDRSDRNGTYYNYIITADLTHNNQGNDTSKKGDVPDGIPYLPDNIPINFNTTFGTLTNTTTTTKGKSTTILISTATNITTISAILDNQTATTTTNVTNINTLGIYNTRTGESFTSIQAAINSQDTQNGDIITLADGIYTENIIIDKKITLEPASEAKVIIRSTDPKYSTLTITNGGDGSTIQNLIIDETCAYGIFLNSVTNCTILNNTISNKDYGIYLNNTKNNTLCENNVVNSWSGIYSNNSSNNLITQNRILNNLNGIQLNNSNSNTISENFIIGNCCGIYFQNASNNELTGNNITCGGIGICYYGSNNITISGNNLTDNCINDTEQIDPTGVVMADTTYTCGPAALATVLNKLGIAITEEELITLAGTEDSGTTMYGLLQAAQSKGVTAKGVSLSINQLQSNNIVFLTINGCDHFSVVTNITNNTVYLADPDLGNIQMSLSDFAADYSGYALIVTTNSSDAQLTKGTALTISQMQNIQGSRWKLKIRRSYHWVGWHKTYYGLGVLATGAASVGSVVTEQWWGLPGSLWGLSQALHGYFS